MITNIISTNISNFYRKDDLSSLIFSRVSRQVAITLTHLFSPVYIYLTLTGNNIEEVYAILFVLTYYFLTFLVKILTQMVSEDFSRKVGFKSIIRFSLPPFLLFVLTLIFSSEYPSLFLLAAIFSGIHIGLFWWGYHGYFVKKGERGHLGQRIGQSNLLSTFASIATPMFGALVIYYFGFPLLFTLSTMFMVTSIILLGKGSKTKQIHDVRLSEVVRLITTHKSVSLAYFAMGAEGIISFVVWPMFLFLFFKKVTSLGIVVSVSCFVASIFAVIVGKWTDKQGERKIVSMGSPILFISWMIRYFSFSIAAFVAGDSMRNFGQMMIGVPLNALSYEKAVEKGTAKAILFFEITQTLGMVAALLVLSALILSGANLSSSFIAASIFSLLPLVAVFKKRLKDNNG